MPIDRVDQLPLPSLHWYAGFSGLALFYAAVYALAAPDGLFRTLWSDAWCTAAVLNMACCCLFLLANVIYSFVFGKLQHVEQQHMRDKFWNFVFYKFIFVFGVLNVQEVTEMLCWCVWFAILGTFLLTEQLCKDRFQFLSFSPNTLASSHAKVIILLVMVFLSCAGLFMVCAIVGWQYGFNHFTFLYSEVFILFARTSHTIIRYLIHLWDMHHDGTWENRNTYTYYTELILELAALCVDFLHHVHMLLWANMFLSVASLILLMKLRFLYQEIQRRLKRHRNYILVNRTLEIRFTLVSKEELTSSDEVCAICWEKMNTARKLPCGHFFHTACLRLWLEQDTVCPTCRCSLREDLRRGVGEEEGEGEGGERQWGWRGRLRRNIRHPRNWLLHFNGASIASWLPTFSVELHQEDGGMLGNDVTELHRGAQHVHSMFPHIPLQAITLDLADTHSISLTVDRILNNAIYIPGQDDVSDSHTPIPPPLASSSQLVHTTPDTPISNPSRPAESQNLNDTLPSRLDADSSRDSIHSESQESSEARRNSASQVTESTGTLRQRRVGQNQEAQRQPPAASSHGAEAEDSVPLEHTDSGGVSLQSSHERLQERTPSEDTVTMPLKSSASLLPSPFLFTTLQQRKDELIKKARRRYLKKHHLELNEQ